MMMAGTWKHGYHEWAAIQNDEDLGLTAKISKGDADSDALPKVRVRKGGWSLLLSH